MNETSQQILDRNKSQMDKIVEDSKRAMDVINLDLEKKFEKFDRETESTRLISRDALYKLMLLESSIIAFSITILSVVALRIDPDIVSLKISWIIFLCSILLGYLSFFIESRAKFSISWRTLQVTEFDKKDYNWLDHLSVIAVVLYTLIVSPRNLIFCRWLKSDKEYKKYIHNMNGKTIGLLADILKIPLFLETISIVLFIIGLWYFIKTFI